MSLKDIISADISNVFLCIDEFAEYHEIDKVKTLCIVDKDISQQRSNRERGQYDGIYKDKIVVFVKEEDLGYQPVFGQAMYLDGTVNLVVSCKSDNGLLEITLEANES